MWHRQRLSLQTSSSCYVWSVDACAIAKGLFCLRRSRQNILSERCCNTNCATALLYHAHAVRFPLSRFCASGRSCFSLITAGVKPTTKEDRMDRARQDCCRLLWLAAAGLACILTIADLGQTAAAKACNAEQMEAADRELWLNSTDKQLSIETHLPWGTPASGAQASGEQLLIQRDYVIGYDDDLLDALWVGYRLESERLGEEGRIDCFRRDPRVDAPAASLPSDYKEPIFDQGHMAPNGDMSTSTNTVINSFIMSNMAPQFCQFNRGVWQILESLVRLWAEEQETIYVITGSVFDRDGDGGRDADVAAKRMLSNNGRSRVAVPSHFYKMLAYERSDGSLAVLTILLPHDQTDLDGDEALDYLGDHISSINVIEEVTDLNLLPDWDGAVDEASMLWPFSGEPSHSLVDNRCRETAGAD